MSKFSLLCIPLIINLIIWVFVLINYIIPLINIPMSEVLDLSLWNIISVVLFFVVWFPLTFYAVVSAIMIIFVDKMEN